MPRVLITGARAPACLEWARLFAAAGWTVWVADSLRWPLSRFSNQVHSFIRLPEVSRDLQAWTLALQNAIVEHQIDCVLPTCEEAFYLAHQKTQLPDTCRVWVSDFALLQQLHHKGQFAEMVGDWVCHAPETQLLTDNRRLPELAQQADGLVFKPAFSRFATSTLIRPKAATVLALQPSLEQPWVAQRFVPGKEFCSFSVLADGQLSAHACYHPKYRVGRGAGVFFEPAQPESIRLFVEQFGRETGFTGQVGFDFIEADDGRFYVLECNPRCTSGVHLFRDQASQLVKALSTSETVLLPTTRQVGMVGLAMLLFASPRQGWKREFWTDFCRANDAIYAGHDRWPIVGQAMGFAEIVGRALWRRRSLLAASTDDIEWNGQALEQTGR